MEWLPKLMGYDYEVVYKKGLENGAAYTLSRLGSGIELLSMFVSTITTGLMRRVQDNWMSNEVICAIITSLRNGQTAKKHYAWINEKLLRKSKIVVGQNENLRKELLQYFHEDFIGGHSGPDLSAYPGLLQPFSIPQTIWSKISMDFIEGLPKLHGKDVIMVVVDRLSKYAHFIGLSHPFNAAQIAQVFLDSVYKLHGMPESIVSDRDNIFISAFWKELFRAMKTPPIHVPYLGGLSKIDVEDRTLLAREEAIQVLKFHLKMVKRNNKAVVYGLVQWANGTVDDASWEDLGKLVAKFPEFDLSS
ncbi:retrotransposon-related protein [Tanacetum coccineum]